MYIERPVIRRRSYQEFQRVMLENERERLKKERRVNIAKQICGDAIAALSIFCFVFLIIPIIGSMFA